MKTKSQKPHIVLQFLQIAALIAFFIGFGFVLPMRAAPSIYSLASVQTAMDARDSELTFHMANRNLSSGETLRLAVSDPASEAQIADLSYSCGSSDTSFGIKESGEIKRLPCGETVSLGDRSSIELVAFSEAVDPVYVPISLSITQKFKTRNVDVVSAVGRKADAASGLPDERTETLK